MVCPEGSYDEGNNFTEPGQQSQKTGTIELGAVKKRDSAR